MGPQAIFGASLFLDMVIIFQKLQDALCGLLIKLEKYMKLIFRILVKVYLYITNLKIDECQLLLALNNNQTLNNNLFSWSTSVQCTNVAH